MKKSIIAITALFVVTLSSHANAVTPRQEAIMVCNDAMTVFRDCYAMAAKKMKLAKALASKKVTGKDVPPEVAEKYCEKGFDMYFRAGDSYRKNPSAVISSLYGACVEQFTPALACNQAFRAVSSVKNELEFHFADHAAYPASITPFTIKLPDGATVTASELNERFYRIKGSFAGCGWSFVTSSEMAGVERE
jgi:hypothetical protein